MKKLMAISMCVFLLSGCSLFVHRQHTILDASYKEKGWKSYTDAAGFVIYYPKEWKFVSGGKEYFQIYNFDQNDMDPTELFTGSMSKTEVHWQKLTDQDLEYYPEIRKVKGEYVLSRSSFSVLINGIQAERWSGRDVLRQAKKIAVYDPNAIRETDLTTEFVTRNTLFVIDTYTSGELNSVPTDDILLLHNSFSF